jgi:hypothetical protein
MTSAAMIADSVRAEPFDKLRTGCVSEAKRSRSAPFDSVPSSCEDGTYAQGERIRFIRPIRIKIS